MGRSAYQYYVTDLSQAQEIAEKILKDNNFVQTKMRSGELVWKKGTGLIMSQQFVSIYYFKEEKRVLLYAWIQGAIGVPGMGEKEVEGLGGAIPKRQLSKVILAIQNEFEKIRP